MTRMSSPWVIVLSFFLILSTVTLSFTANIVLHELGHFTVAKAFDADPEMHFFEALKDADGTLGFNVARLNSEPVAYVLFDAPTSDWEFINIAIAGVLANLLLAALVCYVFTFVKKTFVTELLFLSLLVPCFLSVVINLNVFNPITDGAQILETIRGLL